MATGTIPNLMRILTDPQLFAYSTGVGLRGISWAEKPEGWQVIFRGTQRSGRLVYCLYLAVDLDKAIAGLYQMVTEKGGGPGTGTRINTPNSPTLKYGVR